MFVLILLLAIIPGQLTASEPAAEAVGKRPSTRPLDENKTLASERIARRIVKSFDFDETKLGNFENTPMHWARHVGRGFPKYLESRFDRAAGHDAAPSMLLSLMGGSVGATYEGKDIPVHPRSDYRIMAWIRTERLTHAKASLTAYYLDRAQRKIDKTEIRSTLVGGVGGESWTQVMIDLPGGVEEARWIGLGAWVLQSDAPADSPRPIRHDDMLGAAWFDDISVFRLPRVRLDATQQTGVFMPGEPFVIGVGVADPDGAGIRNELTIRNVTGRTIMRREIETTTDGDATAPLDLSALPPGWYGATLRVVSGDKELTRRDVSAVRLAEDLSGFGGTPSAVGTTLDGWTRMPWAQTHRMLRGLSVGCVKVPFWTGAVSAADLLNGNPAMDRALHDLESDSARVVAVLEEPPAALALQFPPGKRGLLDVLSTDAKLWRPYLAVLISRYAGTVRYWQIGRDGDDRVLADPRMADVASRVMREVAALAGSKGTAVPVALLAPPTTGQLDGVAASVVMPEFVSTQAIGEALSALRGMGSGGFWATLERADTPRYDEVTRLADLARRIVLTRTAGADCLFVPQPWRVVSEGPQRIEPLPDYAVVRTIAQALAGDNRPQAIAADDGVTAWLVERGNGVGTVIAWADGNDAARSIRIPASGKPSTYDIFGMTIPAMKLSVGGSETGNSSEPMATFPVSYSPIIVTPVDVRALRSRVDIRFVDGGLMLSREPQNATIEVANNLGRPISGEMVLQAPQGWAISPLRFEINVPTGGRARIPLEVRLPANQSVGEVNIACHIRSRDDAERSIEARLPIVLVTPTVQVDVWTRVEGERLTVYQRVTNRGDEALDLQSFVVAPGRARATRLIRSLAPGATVEKDYHFDNARPLFGRQIRVGIEQSDGPLRHNVVVDVG